MLALISVLPFASDLTVPTEPPAVLFVSVTEPSFLVSTVVVEPSGFFVVSVTVPVVLSVVVVVVEPSGFLVVLEEVLPGVTGTG